MKFPNPVRFVRSIFGDLLYWWRYGRFMAREETIEWRLRVCGACPHLIDGQCQRCSCFVRLKTQLAGERCDLDYWSEEERTLWQSIGSRPRR